VFTVTYDIGTTTWNDLYDYILTNAATLGFSAIVTSGGSSIIDTPIGGEFAGGESLKSGWFYQVSVAGDKDLGGSKGIEGFAVGDAIIFDGTYFEKCPGTDLIVSVNGKAGAVVLHTDDVQEVAVSAAIAEVSKLAFEADVNGDFGEDKVVIINTPTQNVMLQYYHTNIQSSVPGYLCIPVQYVKESSDIVMASITVTALAGASAYISTSRSGNEVTCTNQTGGTVVDASTTCPSITVTILTNGEDEVPATNRWFSVDLARNAAVMDAINNGITNVAPSQNAVYDALALKADTTALVTPHSALHTLTSDEVTAKAFDLPSAVGATHTGKTVLFPLGGLPQAFGIDFTISNMGLTIGWDALGMDDMTLAAGDKIQVLYFS
jgi:hypothetical protein